MTGSRDRDPELPFAEETYSVARLCDELKACLKAVFPEVWVAGELQRIKEHRNGHLYFELVEKGDGDTVVAKLDAVVWRRQAGSVKRALGSGGTAIADGLGIRCKGRLDFYGPFGRIQFIVSEVDPYFTLGQLEKRRRETLEALAAAGLLEKNRELELPRVPLRIALVTSEGSAAYHDFITTLAESGYGFEVLFIHSAVQGTSAELDVVSALAAAGRSDVDCIALVRGGGSRTDLAAFDSRAVAEAIATARHPVITGIGHEIDESIADLAAHTRLKTPTGAAEFLVEKATSAESELSDVGAALGRLATGQLHRAAQRVSAAERGVGAARIRLRSAAETVARIGEAAGRLARSRLVEQQRTLTGVAGRLASGAPRQVARRRTEPSLAAQRLAALGRSRVREARASVDGIARLCEQLGPQRTLSRGFSITRLADGGLVRSSEATAIGEQIVTELAEGSLTSRVEKR